MNLLNLFFLSSDQGPPPTPLTPRLLHLPLLTCHRDFMCSQNRRRLSSDHLCPSLPLTPYLSGSLFRISFSTRLFIWLASCAMIASLWLGSCAMIASLWLASCVMIASLWLVSCAMFIVNRLLISNKAG
uniref:Uncharacterized protein n=1 Tax=Cacopsylla melanoneura TaxID=428564 RepID=A0A8D9F9E4_9HEMI